MINFLINQSVLGDKNQSAFSQGAGSNFDARGIENLDSFQNTQQSARVQFLNEYDVKNDQSQTSLRPVSLKKEPFCSTQKKLILSQKV